MKTYYKQLAVALMFSVLSVPVQAAISDLVVRSNDVPGWGFSQGDYSVNPMLSVFFENYDSTYESQLGFPLKRRQRQSYATESGRATVFYMEFADSTQAKSAGQFLRQLMKGYGNSKSENVIVKENTIVVVSSSYAKLVQKLTGMMASK